MGTDRAGGGGRALFWRYVLKLTIWAKGAGRSFFSSTLLVRDFVAPESQCNWLLRHLAFRAAQIKRVRDFKFWEDGNHAILLDTTEQWEQRMNYLHQNPVAAGIVREAQNYIFSSAGDYAGIKVRVDVELA